MSVSPLKIWMTCISHITISGNSECLWLAHLFDAIYNVRLSLCSTFFFFFFTSASPQVSLPSSWCHAFLHPDQNQRCPPGLRAARPDSGWGHRPISMEGQFIRAPVTAHHKTRSRPFQKLFSRCPNSLPKSQPQHGQTPAPNLTQADPKPSTTGPHLSCVSPVGPSPPLCSVFQSVPAHPFLPSLLRVLAWQVPCPH